MIKGIMKVLMKVLILLPLQLSSMQIQATTPNELAGSWLNQDPSTGGVTHILITAKDGALSLGAWGSCEPQDCSWGTTNLSVHEGVAAGILGTGPIKMTMFVVRLPNDKLLVVSKSEFSERPDVHDTEHAEIFVREASAQDAVSTNARAILREVANTYRNLPSAQFESEEISESEDVVSVRHVKTTFSPPDKSRTEISGSGESEVAVYNDHTLWLFFPESNEYAAYPGQPNSVYSYGSLDQIVGTASVSGSDRIRDVDCTVLKIERPNKSRTLWIDPQSHFVLKDKMTSKSISPSGESRLSVTITFSVARTAASIDEHLFSFDPQATKAKLRTTVQKDALTKSIGTEAPNFSLFDLNGKEIELSQLRGKAVLLNFWSSWCVPCRAEMPTIELLHRQLKDKGLVVLGIDEEETQIQATFLSKSGFSFASIAEPKRQVSNRFGVGGIPTTILIDQKGYIRSCNRGSVSYEDLRKTLKDMGITLEPVPTNDP